MRAVFVGEIFAASEGVPTPPIYLPPQPPPVVWPGPGVPTPPIYYPPQPPPVVWPQPPGGVVTPPIYYPPVAGQGPGFPTPPIHLPPLPPVGGGGPPVIWPGPGVPTPPIYLPPEAGTPPPGTVTPPIYLPERPEGGYIVIWVPGVGYVAVPITGEKPTHPVAPTPAPKA